MCAATQRAQNVTIRRKNGCLSKLAMAERPTVYNSFRERKGRNEPPLNNETCGFQRGKWLRGMDSNHDNQLQRLVSYQLDDPGIVQRSRAKSTRARVRIITGATQ